MIILFVGPQASGKGTQAKIISKKLNLVHISTGDMLRAATGELKREINTYINKGQLVPDKLILKLLKKRIKEKDCQKGIILDGYPRNLSQVQDLKEILKIDKILEIDISDEEATKRLKGRWNCKKCGIAYNYVTQPKPEKLGVCDICQQPLTQREDDANESAIKKRLSIYHKDTEPMLKKYPHVNINGKQSIEKITQDILEVLQNFK